MKRSGSENAKSFNELIEAIFFIKNASKNEKDTLVFIDEIQNSPAAVKYLRYFYENKSELPVIAAGSLPETLIDKETSSPVGRVEYLAVIPFLLESFFPPEITSMSLEPLIPSLF